MDKPNTGSREYLSLNSIHCTFNGGVVHYVPNCSQFSNMTKFSRNLVLGFRTNLSISHHANTKKVIWKQISTWSTFMYVCCVSGLVQFTLLSLHTYRQTDRLICCMIWPIPYTFCCKCFSRTIRTSPVWDCLTHCTVAVLDGSHRRTAFYRR